MVNLVDRLEPAVKALGKGCLIAVFCAAIQNSSSLVSSVSGLRPRFEQVDKTTWNADLAKLENGFYFLPLGRPKAACDIILDQKVLIASNRSSKVDLRSSLLLGAPLLVSNVTQSKQI